MGCHALLQGIFPSQGSNPSLLSPALACGFFTTEPPGKLQGTSHPDGNVLTELFTEVRTGIQGPWLRRQPGSQELRSCPTCCGSEPHHTPKRARSGWNTGEVVREKLHLVPDGGRWPRELAGREGGRKPLSASQHRLGRDRNWVWSAPAPPLLVCQKHPHQAARGCSVIVLKPFVCRGFPGGGGGKEPACQGRRPKRCRSFLGLQDLPGQGMATHSSILAWRIHGTGEPGGLQSMGLKESDRTEPLSNNSNVSAL